MRIALTTTLLAALVVPTFAGFTDALDPVTTAVQQRQGEVDATTKRGRRAYRALVAAEDHLLRDATSLSDDLRALSRCAQLLERRFGDDEPLMTVLDTALDDLEGAAEADRDRLDGELYELQDKRKVVWLMKGLEAYERKARSAARAGKASKAARRLRAGWKKLAKAEAKVGLGPKPDFALVDVNATSTSEGREISPRDYLGKISAWYFGHST